MTSGQPKVDHKIKIMEFKQAISNVFSHFHIYSMLPMSSEYWNFTLIYAWKIKFEQIVFECLLNNI